LAWVAGNTLRWFEGANGAQRTIISLIRPTPLPPRHATTHASILCEAFGIRNYFINSVKLQHENCIKDLGVVSDSDPSVSLHRKKQLTNQKPTVCEELLNISIKMVFFAAIGAYTSTV